MKSIWLVLFLVVSQYTQADQNSVFDVIVTSKEKLSIGQVVPLRFEIKNISDQSVAILEIRPAQPCEEPISLIRSLYGKIDYDQEADAYIYDSQPQSATMIPVVEGFLLPGQSLWLNVRYRPFDIREQIFISYAAVGDQKIYVRTKEEGPTLHFTLQGTDYTQVILSRLTELDRREQAVQIAFRGMTGEISKLCYCETLKTYVDFFPPSLCKEWDSGTTVKFRVGEKQEGMGPDVRQAGWKFLDVYSVYFGDGMYTHGEFIDIPPDAAEKFAAKLKDRYSVKKVSYFFTDHYYDLEPNP